MKAEIISEGIKLWKENLSEYDWDKLQLALRSVVELDFEFICGLMLKAQKIEGSNCTPAFKNEFLDELSRDMFDLSGLFDYITGDREPED